MNDNPRSNSLHVTFRLMPKDIERFEDATTPLAYKVVLFTLAGMTLIAVALATIVRLRDSGLGPALSGPLGSLLFAVAFAVAFLSWKRWRRGTQPGPEISVAIAPEGLVIRQEGLTELRRSWPSIAEIRDDGQLIHFVPDEFDYSTGHRVRLRSAAIIVPIRAFPTREEVDSFLGAARRWHSAIEP